MERIGRAVWLKLGRKRLRPLLLAGIVVLTVMQIVVFSPSSVEEGEDSHTQADAEGFLPEKAETLAPGIPKDRIADYTVEQYNHVSTQGGQRQWKLLADRAYLFNDLKLVHSRVVKAHLFDPDGRITVITGRESKYFMDQKDLEIFGNVHAVFPDGFEIRSEYLRYRPGARKVEIPQAFFVTGTGKQEGGQQLDFESHGLDFSMEKSVIVLPRSAKVRSDSTEIRSDRAVIYRKENLAKFTMASSRPLETRFVEIAQPNLRARSRTAELNYGDLSRVIHYLIAQEDVLIHEVGPKADPAGRQIQAAPKKYATGGKAAFDSRRNVIVLTEFPQVYQDHDTVTGDVILLHRDTDIVEVEHSNAFSQGSRAE